MIPIFKNLLWCFITQNIVWLQESGYVSLKRMCILLLLDGVVYRCQLYPVDWWCFWVTEFCLLDLSVSDRRVLYSTIIVYSSVFLCSSISFCLTHFDALLLDACMLRSLVCLCHRSLFLLCFLPALLLNASLVFITNSHLSLFALSNCYGRVNSGFFFLNVIPNTCSALHCLQPIGLPTGYRYWAFGIHIRKIYFYAAKSSWQAFLAMLKSSPLWS